MSLSLLRSGDFSGFQSFGATIIVMSILSISLNRARYSEIRALWDRRLIVELYNYQESLRKDQSDALDRTFNLHAAQIAQISFCLGRGNPFVPATESSIIAFCKEVEEKFTEFDISHKESKDKEEKFSKFKSDYFSETESVDSWSGFFLKVEAVLLCWGTLQSAYGLIIADALSSFMK